MPARRHKFGTYALGLPSPKTIADQIVARWTARRADPAKPDQGDGDPRSVPVEEAERP